MHKRLNFLNETLSSQGTFETVLKISRGLAGRADALRQENGTASGRCRVMSAAYRTGGYMIELEWLPPTGFHHLRFSLQNLLALVRLLGFALCRGQRMR